MFAVAGDEEEAADSVERNFIDDLNPDSKRVITAFVESALANAEPEERVQFERHGYFVADVEDHAPGRPVFNRAVSLRDPWEKRAAAPQGTSATPQKSTAPV